MKLRAGKLLAWVMGGVLLTGGLVQRAAADWTAYNDFDLQAGELSANITSYNGSNTNGALIDYGSGSTLGAQINLNLTTSTYFVLGFGTQDTPAGTDAILVFTNKLSPQGYFNWAPPATLTTTLSGLDSTKRYNVVLFGNRGVSNYTDRTNYMVISSVSSFSNNSSSAAIKSTASMANDTTAIVVGFNTNNLVWRYDSINPGGDGTIVFTQSGSQGGCYINAMMVQETTPAAGPSAPTIQDDAPTVLSTTSAAANGSLTSTGTVPTQVWMYWKQGSDGGAVKSGWSNNGYMGYKATGSLTTNLTGLSSNTTYYYRYYASNSVGETWASPAQSFTTPVGGANTTTVSLTSADKRQWYPCTRRCGIIISEIMYNPATPYTNNMEFVELYNTESFSADVGKWRLAGPVDYTFPTGTVIGARSYMVVAKNPSWLQSYYSISGVMGPYSNSLNGSATVKLYDSMGSLFLEAKYSSDYPWPASADGAGHSLVLTCPDYGEGDIRAWSASVTRNGNPGSSNRTLSASYTLKNIRINEFLAHTDPPLEDSIELYNGGTGTVDVGGCYLSDSESNLTKYQIPVGTFISAHGCKTFGATQLGFNLSMHGGSIFVMNPSSDVILDAVKYDAQENAVPYGRYPDGSGDFVKLNARTDNALNTGTTPRTESIVINEIMFSPLSGDNNDQYVELFNKSATNVNVGSWRFTQGINYAIPAGTMLASSNYLVVAAKASQLLGKYTNLTSATVIGDFNGSLSGTGERLVLAKPDDPTLPNQDFVTMDEVTYSSGWGQWANGGGSSLELKDPRSDNRLGMNWGDSDETQKAPWSSLEVIDNLDNEDFAVSNSWNSTYYMKQIKIWLDSDGECQLDELHVLRNGSDLGIVQNSSLDAGTSGWITSQGTVKLSTWEATNGFNASGCIHMIDQGGGDHLMDSLCATLNAGLNPNDTQVAITLKARWLCGSPNINAQLMGNGFWLQGVMAVPQNLGTPGQKNSRNVGNIGPALEAMTQSPILPPANSNVTITVHANDPDGIQGVDLKWRLDPSLSYSTVAMNDSGTGVDSVSGDGTWSGTIPGQSSSAFVGFYLSARDNNGAATSTYPWGGPSNEVSGVIVHEAELMFGITNPVCDYPIVRTLINPSMDQPGSSGAMWNWDRLDHMTYPVSVVYGDFRVIHGGGSQLTSSIWTRGKPGILNFPWWDGGHEASTYRTFNQTFDVEFPDGDGLLGANSFHLYDMNYMNRGRTNLTAPSDSSFTGEPAEHWTGKQMGLYYIPMKYMHLFANDIHKSIIDVDEIKPKRGDYLKCFFPDDPDGDLYSCYGWYEASRSTGNNDNGGDGPQQYSFIGAYKHDDGRLRGEMYRLLWKRRAGDSSNNDMPLANIGDAIDHNLDSSAASQKTYVQRISKVMDVENWARSIAWRHVIGDWDSFGFSGRNMMVYIPKVSGKSKLIEWDVSNGFDMDSASTNGPDLWNSAETNIATRLYQCYAFRRAFWRGVKDMLDGPMSLNGVGAYINKEYAGHQSNNLAYWKNKFNANPNYDDQVMTQSNLQHKLDWISGRQDFIYKTYLFPSLTNISFTSSGPGSSGSKTATFSGQASVQVRSLKVNGMPVQDENVVWTSDTQYQMDVGLTNAGNNSITVTAWDGKSNLLATVGPMTVNYTGSSSSPSGNIVITEIMYDPPSSGAGYIEFYNKSATETFDLNGIKVSGADFTFPLGSFIGPQSYKVIVSSELGFYQAYTNDPTMVLGQYSGSLQNNGETIDLKYPAGTNAFGVTNWVTVDTVKYNNNPPWPVEASGAGYSLQLIDVNQDNNRGANWACNARWQKVTVTGVAGGGNPSGRLYIYTTNTADFYVDDVKLVAGSTPDVGVNLASNGDFESVFPGPWQVAATYQESGTENNLGHLGTHALHVKASIPGTGSTGNSIQQDFAGVTNGSTYTLSFWYLAPAKGVPFVLRFSGSWISVSTNVTVTDPYTPGRANAVATSLSAIPSVWINEIMPNSTSYVDNVGQVSSWLELLNNGGSSVDLVNGNYYMTDDYDNMTKWKFQGSQTLNAGSRTVVWCDNQTNQTATGSPHAGFSLNAFTGTVALVQLNNGRTTVVDYVNYSLVPANKSWGAYPDGVVASNQVMDLPTPGAVNSASSAVVVVQINEWMANNSTIVPDPADDKFQDWIELYNPNAQSVDVSGYLLTDTNTLPDKFNIPLGRTIPAYGFMLIWMDNQTSQTDPSSYVHANFKLNSAGGYLGLRAPDGRLVDSVTYGDQQQDVSEGRYPDGMSVFQMATPTPGATNRLLEASSAVLTNGTLHATWNTQPGKRYRIEYNDDIATTNWNGWGLDTNVNTSTINLDLPIQNSRRSIRLHDVSQ